MNSLQFGMQHVHENGEKLVRVLLLGAGKRTFELANDIAKIARCNVSVASGPYLCRDRSQLFNNLTIRSAISEMSKMLTYLDLQSSSRDAARLLTDQCASSSYHS